MHALANLAYQSSFLGMPRQALRFAEAAEQVAKSHDPRGKMTVVPHIRRATAYAIAGDRSDSDRAMTRAQARVRLELKEVDGAALAANEALDDLNGEVESWVVSVELREVAAKFTEHRRHPEVARFISRYVTDRT